MQLQQTAFDYHLDYISDQIQVATGVGQSANMLISTATKRNAQRQCVVCVNTPRRPKKGTDSRYECTECNVGLYFWLFQELSFSEIFLDVFFETNINKYVMRNLRKISFLSKVSPFRKLTWTLVNSTDVSTRNDV